MVYSIRISTILLTKRETQSICVTGGRELSPGRWSWSAPLRHSATTVTFKSFKKKVMIILTCLSFLKCKESVNAFGIASLSILHKTIEALFHVLIFNPFARLVLFYYI